MTYVRMVIVETLWLMWGWWLVRHYDLCEDGDWWDTMTYVRMVIGETLWLMRGWWLVRHYDMCEDGDWWDTMTCVRMVSGETLWLVWRWWVVRHYDLCEDGVWWRCEAGGCWDTKAGERIDRERQPGTDNWLTVLQTLWAGQHRRHGHHITYHHSQEVVRNGSVTNKFYSSHPLHPFN